MWNGRFWQNVDMSDLDDDLAIQLGHDGGPCAVPDPEPRKLIVVDSGGLRSIRVHFCACQPNDRWVQLLRAKLYPSSTQKPRSCWTFDFLDSYIKVSLQGKLALYDYYLAVLHKSHNTATSDKLVTTLLLYTPFILMVLKQHALWSPLSIVSRQYMHLKMLKRAGRGHGDDAARASQSPHGSLALLCPACPQPGKNLSSGWELSPSAKQYVLALEFRASDFDDGQMAVQNSAQR
jgi:hypothetical protein